MKALKRLVLIIFVLLSTAVIALYLTGNRHIFRGVMLTYLDGKNGPTIDDGLKFNRDTLISVQPQPWSKSSDYGKMSIPPDLLDSLEHYQTVAFLVIDQDSIVHEQYWDHYSESSLTNSFSMAKSLVGLAIGTAIEDGYIGSVDEPAAKYLPHLADERNAKLTIKHLLQMASGIDFGESYSSPFGFVAKAYYGYDLGELVKQYEVSYEPGTRYHYQGGNTQLLAMIIEEATGKPFVEYFNQRIWSKLGAERDAWWTLDEQGLARASCCFYSNARDYARLARLMLRKGKWNGEQVIPEHFVEEALSPIGIPDANGDVVNHYGYQWWLSELDGDPCFALRGLQGQYIIAFPERDLIIVRLGHKRSEHRRNNMPVDMFHILEIGCIMDR